MRDKIGIMIGFRRHFRVSFDYSGCFLHTHTGSEKLLWVVAGFFWCHTTRQAKNVTTILEHTKHILRVDVIPFISIIPNSYVLYRFTSWIRRLRTRKVVNSFYSIKYVPMQAEGVK